MSIVDFDGDERALKGDIRLNGVGIDLVVGGGLQAFDEELTVNGSPIIRISILDPDRELVRSGLLDLDADGDPEKLNRDVELIVDGVAYWLRQVGTQPGSDTVELTFEDREVCRLRDVGGAQKMRGGAGNDRDFIKQLCAKAGAPEPITTDLSAREQQARKGERIGRTSKLRSDAERRANDRNRRPGLAEHVRLTVKGSPASPSQIDVGSQVLVAAQRYGATPKTMLALVEAAIVENEFSNSDVINDPGSTSVGVFQAQYGLSAGVDGTISREQALDIDYMVKSFLQDPGFASKGGALRLERENPSWTAGQIAQRVEMSAYPERYDQVEVEARDWVEKFTGGKFPLTSGATLTTTTTREAALTVERDESLWDAAVRTASERNARWFVVANQPYYLYDDALMRSRPVATIADPGHPDADPERIRGVTGIGWEWAPRRPLRKTDLVVNATVQQLPPGSVVILDETCGPAGSDDAHPNRGRWLVGDYSRSRFSHEARITLIKGRRPIVPTVTDTRTQTIGGPSAALSADALSATDISGMTPKQIIDTIVLPIAQSCGIQRTVAQNDAGNASHGPTVNGTRSDHQGPPDDAWAADMSNGTSPTPEMDRLATLLAAKFRIPPLDLSVTSSDANAHSVTWGGFRFQLIYRSGVGGDHTNHNHFGVRRV